MLGDSYNMKPGFANYYVEAMKCALRKYCVLPSPSAETAQIVQVHILNTWITGFVPSLHAGF